MNNNIIHAVVRYFLICHHHQVIKKNNYEYTTRPDQHNRVVLYIFFSFCIVFLLVPSVFGLGWMNWGWTISLYKFYRLLMKIIDFYYFPSFYYTVWWRQRVVISPWIAFLELRARMTSVNLTLNNSPWWWIMGPRLVFWWQMSF